MQKSLSYGYLEAAGERYLEESNKEEIKVPMKGRELLRSPLWNKGSAFTEEEREKLDLLGLLPPYISTIDQQLARRYANFLECENGLSKYHFLTGLQNRNETLFFRFCSDHVVETLPYIYTPVVGEASLNFSLHYHHSRGLYIPYEQKDNIEEILKNAEKKEVEVIVATDGGRILGLGDVGVGGMTIPIGKTSLYTLFGGVAPGLVLPVFLDVGTDNEELLKDPLYLGRRKNRISGEQYYEFMDAFVDAVKKVFPEALLQWEDLLGKHAQKVLDRYKDSVLSFNDDIQGTASVVLAGLLSALKMKGSALKEEKIAIFGGGAAGLGIGKSIYRYLLHHSVSEDVARDAIYIIDRDGLTYHGQEGLREEHTFFAKDKPAHLGPTISLDETIEHFGITILIGASAQKGAFKEKTIQGIMKHTTIPIVFPLSNPHTKAEATPEMIIKTSKGKAIVATGTAFPAVEYEGKTYQVQQCNNVYIFPGIGLFTTAFDVKTIPEEFFFIAGETLSRISPPLLFPEFPQLKEASKQIAFDIAKYAAKEGMIEVKEEADILLRLEKTMWSPNYKKYV
ncbi:oxaloacetate-decarboxylating malate dehydrogenase [bacterium]|nr:oxaloacetate-decarboxylating malate dehydrogenase [bacterium]